MDEKHSHFKLLLHHRTERQDTLRVLHRFQQPLCHPTIHHSIDAAVSEREHETYRAQEEVERSGARIAIWDERVAFFLREGLEDSTGRLCEPCPSLDASLGTYFLGICERGLVQLLLVRVELPATHLGKSD